MGSPSGGHDQLSQCGSIELLAADSKNDEADQILADAGVAASPEDRREFAAATISAWRGDRTLRDSFDRIPACRATFNR